jgi:hypothetical protein
MILRGFGATLREIVFETEVELDPGRSDATVQSKDFGFAETFNTYSVETVLRWSGQRPLLLASAPVPQAPPNA